jgi:hypothetical protein
MEVIFVSKQNTFGVIVEKDERRILFGKEEYIKAAVACVPRTAEKPLVKVGLVSEEQMQANIDNMQKNFPNFTVYPVEAFPYIIDFAKWGVS